MTTTPAATTTAVRTAVPVATRTPLGGGVGAGGNGPIGLPNTGGGARGSGHEDLFAIVAAMFAAGLILCAAAWRKRQT
jgi:hypothetical protein